mgnify:CR=1 FL=1
MKKPLQLVSVIIFLIFNQSFGQIYTDEVQVVEGLGGKVGIGTNSPMGILHLNSNYPQLYLTGEYAAIRGNDDTWLFGYGGILGSEDISIGTQDNTGSRTLTLAAGGLARMKILANGRVGIGTTTPSTSLHVVGSLLIEDTEFIRQYSSYKYGGRFTYYTANPNYYVRYGHNFDGPSVEVSLSNNGGGTTTQAYFYMGATSWSFNSDRKLKENIRPITDAMDKVMTISGVNYEFIADETNVMKYGFVAQDVQKIAPELVKENTKPDGSTVLSVAHSDMISILWNAVQELKEEKDTEITKLKEQLERQNSLIKGLESRLSDKE